MSKLYKFIGLCLMALTMPVYAATFHMSNIFSDNMVLQQGMPIPLWGTAPAGSKVTVRFKGHAYQTQALESCKWNLKLPTQKVGGPYTLQIANEKDSLEFKNVMVGEVWVCSGQSNMLMEVSSVNNAKEEIAQANYPQIRLIHVKRQRLFDGHTKGAGWPQEELPTVDGKWNECSPETIPNFSATAYFFARSIYQKTGVPIGLICSAVGGSSIESWTPKEFLKLKNPRSYGSSDLYNTMIAPAIQYGIRGVIWYQGEANTQNAYEYRKLLPVLIRSWREKWAQGNFPFYYMQLPIFGDKEDTDKTDSDWAELRDAQRNTLSVPNTGMAVTLDFNDPDLHPRNKQDFGQRLSLIALRKLYGQNVDYEGPLYQGYRVEGKTIRIFFSNPKIGLKSRNEEPLKGFVMAGEDHKFHLAQAKIEGQTVVVSCDEVVKPAAVRYAWSQWPLNNLISAAGLPASPFRTDHWKLTTQR